MDNKNEILSAVREAKKHLGEGADFRISDALDTLEGIAPFLEKEVVIGLKCKRCDNYASSTFPLSGDYWAVDHNEHCHEKKNSFKNLSALKLAVCPQYSRQENEELTELAQLILDEDLKPGFSNRKLYDRSKFASYRADFRILSNPGNVCIEFGHATEDGFNCSDIRLFIIKRLDPGFGEEASRKISEALKNGPVMAVKASLQTRRQLDIDYVLEWIAKKRKMDIVYL